MNHRLICKIVSAIFVWLIFTFQNANTAEAKSLFDNDSLALGNKKYSFLYGFDKPYIPPKDPNDTTKKPFFLKGVFSGNIGFQSGRLIYYDTDINNYKGIFRGAFTGTVNVKLYKQLQLSTTFFGNLQRQNLPFWISDFFYSLKWFNWRPYTFSFGYENFVDNRFNENADDWGKKFLQGYFFVSFNQPLPKKWLEKIRLDQSTNFTITYMARYHYQYRDEMDNVLDHKPVMMMSMRYTIWKRLFLEGGVYYYPIAKTKVAWDPDFTYGFGYFDWRPWRVSLTYGNWIGNRFKPGTKQLPYYNILDGNLNLTFNYQF